MLSGTPLCYQKNMQIITLQCVNLRQTLALQKGGGRGSYLSEEVRGGNEEMLELSLVGEVCFLRTKRAGVRK